MKTKISHLGRSTVSVILAVMMLLSTMLIGTVSTVNAVSGTVTVYFKDTLNWDNVYAYFYGGSYWNDTQGSGSANIAGGPIKMTKVDGTDDIYSCTYTGTYSQYISFTRDSQSGFNNFNNTQAVYRGDFDSSKSLFTPDTTQTNKLNETVYYNNGTWSTYSGGSGGGSTEATFNGGDTYYLQPTTNYWNKDSATFKITLSQGVNGSVETTIDMTKVSDSPSTYCATLPEGSWNVLTFKRMNKDGAKEWNSASTSENGVGNPNNGQNCFTETNWNNAGTWSTYSATDPVAKSVSLTASSETVKVGNSVTLTAVANNPASENLTYQFTKTIGGEANETQNNNKLTVTPSAAGTYKYKVTVSANGFSPVTSTEVSFTVTAPVTYYLGGRVAQTQNNSDWTAPDSITNTSCKFVETETDGLYKYESDQTPAAWSETRNDLLQYFYVRTSLGGALYYGNAEPGDDALALTAQGQKANLAEISNTDVKNLIYINSNDTSTNATFWLDTRNNEYKLWYTTALPHNVKVADGVSATVDKETATAGEKVTVTATPISGEVLKSVTVKAADGTTVETTVSGNTATFTMPDQNVTVTGVTFRTAETYTVTFRSSDDKFGTVSAMKGTTSLTSGDTVTEGDTVTFTAKPASGYAFSSWTVNGAQASSTTNPYKITVNSNTTVVANFKVEDSGAIAENMHFLYGTSNKPNELQETQEYKVYEKDGKYIVTLNEKHYKELYFAFSKDDSYVNMEPNTGLKAVNPDNPKGLSLVDAKPQEYYLGSVQYLFGKMSIVGENSDYIGDIKIIYDPDANTYTVKATKDSASDTTVNIVGKDGTVRKDYYGKTTSALGDTELTVTSTDGTTITAIDSCNMNDTSQGVPQGVTAKKVPYGSEVTVKTTINPNATFAGHKGSDYYVKGFSINGFTGGVLTQQAGKSHEGDVYEYTFTVKKDVYADVSTIEITPIYFLKNDSNCITFYVENFMDAKAKWGDTIACYAYYSDGDNSGNALGDYPGQPMVNAEGSIYMQIPKYIGNDTTNVVKGITLNNYVWDFVHVSGGDDVRKQKNCQTYDYDDFKYLANMSQVNSSDSASADIKNIVYRFKYHTYNNTSADASAGVGNIPNDKLTGTSVDDTKYEVFVDYYDKPTDIFGTIINSNDAVTVDTVKAQPKYLTIVSDGYVNYYKVTDKYLGQYATKWYIYNEANQKVAALPPSALLYGLTKSSSELESLVNREEVPQDFMSDSGASTSVISGYWASFKSLYKNYAGKYAIINYESAIRSGGRDGADNQPGERCDGRWYYSVDRAKITGDIRIEYADTLDSFTTMEGVKTDTFKPGTAKGEITAAEAYFTSPAGQSTTDKPTHVETTSDNSENFMFTVGATSSTSYTFVGWYRLIDDTYKAVNDPSELNKTTGQVARNANVVLVARYIKTPGGSMTFHHSLYNGTNAGGGKATTEIQVVVKDSTGKSLYNSERIAGTVSIDKNMILELATKTGLTVTVTLYTTTKNLYNFNGYYSAKNTTDITAFNPPTTDFTTTVTGNRKEGLVTTSEYTFSFDEYYAEYAHILTAADAGTVYYNFYSDITSIKVPYKVQFSYEDREGNQKYYNKAGYVDPENTSSYTFVEKNTETNGEGSKAVEVTLTDSFILSLAPYESNFTKNLTWNKTPDSNTAFDSSDSKSIASAVVNSTQSDRTIHLNVFRDSDGNPTPLINDDGVFKPYEKDGSTELPYGSVFYTSNGDGTYTYDITAPKTYNDKQFMYWAIYSDPDCKNLVINAYNSEGHFSYVAYDNCWIVPVYEESSTPSASVKKVYTTTQFMEVTRNQWTADKADSFTGFDVDTMTTLDDFKTDYGEDKLYADFVLNFFYNGKQLSTFDPTSSKVQTGVLIQRLELDRNETTGYITDLDHYANKKFTPEQLDDAKKDAIKKITTGNSVIPSVKQQINNSRLDNKNRLQYYTRFNNVKGNNDCVFRLYTYIQYTNAEDQKVVELSDPVYFTFYDIANK